MALIVTPGAANANSYATEAEADAYHATRPGSDWSTRSSADKQMALIMATRLLDAMPEAWTGAAASATQALGWPRSGMYSRNGFAIANTTVPQELKNAEAEWAEQLLAADLLASSAVVAEGVTSLKAGPVAITFKDSLTRTDALMRMVPDAVRMLLVPSWLVDLTEEDEREGLLFEVL